MNDIIAFIDKAMDKDYLVYTDISKDCYIMITINCSSDDNFLIGFTYAKLFDGTNSFTISKHRFNQVEIELTESDILKFELEALKVKEYSKNKLINYFNDFFKKDSKVIDINDLDNEEE